MPPPCKWLCQAIEQHYLTHLKKTLAKPQLDTAYRAYLERTAKAIDQAHKGYFAASHSDKSQEEAISLILKEKENASASPACFALSQAPAFLLHRFCFE
jgi:restriction endonuclease